MGLKHICRTKCFALIYLSQDSCERGTIKVAVRIKAAGNKNYKAATRTVSVRIIVR